MRKCGAQSSTSKVIESNYDRSIAFDRFYVLKIILLFIVNISEM